MFARVSIAGAWRALLHAMVLCAGTVAVPVLHVPPSAAQSAEPWQTPEGRICIQRWITQAGQVLNRHSGDADFNKRKPWRITQYGLFQAEGLRSEAPPDDWAQYDADVYRWMWEHYTSQAEYPDWDNDNFEAAYLKGLRWFVSSCLTTAPQTAAIDPNEPGTDRGDTPAAGGGSEIMAVDQAATCPANFSMHQNSTLTLICYCPPGTAAGAVWGTGIYTHDSALCTAAVHAGAVGSDGGMVRVKGEPGHAEYRGTAGHGITSQNYGTFGWSFYFPDVYAPGTASLNLGVPFCPANMTQYRGTSNRISCHCAPSAIAGSVWGTDVYTDDSALCMAALHAGAVGPSGGMVTAVALPGRASYSGSTRNGVATSSYGEWQGSYQFER